MIVNACILDDQAFDRQALKQSLEKVFFCVRMTNLPTMAPIYPLPIHGNLIQSQHFTEGMPSNLTISTKNNIYKK
jgi:hypothetical protein